MNQVHGPRTTAVARAEGRLKKDVVGGPRTRKQSLLRKIIKRNSKRG